MLCGGSCINANTLRNNWNSISRSLWIRSRRFLERRILKKLKAILLCRLMLTGSDLGRMLLIFLATRNYLREDAQIVANYSSDQKKPINSALKNVLCYFIQKSPRNTLKQLTIK